MDRNAKKQYFVQYIYDEDADVKRTFSVTAQGGTRAVERVGEFCDKNKDILPQGRGNYASRVRILRQRDTVEFVVPDE